MQANLKLLKIIGYFDNQYKKQISAKPYTVMINPESINRQQFNNSDERTNFDKQSKINRHIPCDELSFNLIIDCTGIVDSERTNMTNEIQALEEVLFTHKRGIQLSNFVKIQWGENFTFKSKLKSFNSVYTLFKPDGTPLRAKIALSFGM